MIARWILLCSCLMACVAQAAVTAGWKMPVSSVTGGRKVDDLPKLDKPPGESAFFEPGDVLRDLKPLLSTRVGVIRVSGAKDDSTDPDPFSGGSAAAPAGTGPWSGDWVVWNERSGMIVARGSYNDLFVAEEALGFWDRARIIQTKMEIVVADPTQSRSMQVAARSGEKASMEVGGFSADVEPTSSESGSMVDLRLSPGWPGPGEGESWNVLTAVTLPAGKRTLVAAHGSGKGRWELFVTAAVEYPGGVPVREARWIERKGHSEAWPRIDAIDDDGMSGSLADGQVSWLYKAPFADALLAVWSGELRVPFSKVTAPEVAGDWMRGEAADLREKFDLKDQGKLAFAGLDSRSRCIVLVGDAPGVKAAQEILWDLGGGCCLTSLPLVVESNAEAGGWLLASRSGEKASIGLSSGEEDMKELFVIEPTFGNALADLRFAMDIMPENEVVGHVESSAALIPGQAQEVGAYTAAGGGAERKFTLVVRKLAP